MALFKGKIFCNASWIIVSKLMQAVLAFVVSILTARYLGPSNYGLISYAASLVTFVIPISQLGYNNTIVQELTDAPQKEGEILGASILFGLMSSTFCMIGVVSFSAIANFGDKETVWVVAIYSVNLIFQALDLIQYWFQAKLLSKYSSIATLIAYAVVACYKLALLIAQKNVYWFAASHAIDYFLIAVILMILYRKLGGQKLSADVSMGKKMFAKSKYYIVPGLMVAIFSQTDKIMLQNMLGEYATGCYSAAVSIASVSSFVYVAIIDSFRPVIFSNQENEELLDLNLKRLYAIVIYLSLAQSAVMTLFADFFVNILYGAQYQDSVGALRIIVWYITFSYLGSIRNIWILAQNKQKYLWRINASGAVLNVVLNYILIPAFGVSGAAVASLATQVFANYVVGFVPTIRKNNFLMMESLNPKHIFSLLKKTEK